ncbi:MAG: phosphoglycerate kinase [Candidatus Roizmanbacteria bacterium]|nr:MAG: phosphoglycerate kinase [Candidatus Roizmanbacteria bacterium]
MSPLIKFIDEAEIINRKILLRVDFNVSFNPDHTIADDLRIRQALPTINYLLNHQYKLILISHLGNPKNRDSQYSLQPVANRLQTFLPNYEIKLINDLSEESKNIIQNQQENQIFILENIRFYPEEKNNDLEFAKKLALLGEIFINDAFSVCHRTDASIITLPKLLPSYGGLLLKKEIKEISKIIKNPKKPFVAIIGGAKISTKIPLLYKLIGLADYVLIGGGIANTFLSAQGYDIGTSITEESKKEDSKNLIELASQKNTKLLLPIDVVVEKNNQIKKIYEVLSEDKIMDIGPDTQEQFKDIIVQAKTIIWNGPMGFFENPLFKKGTDSVFQAITENKETTSIIGGGDTTVAISRQEKLSQIGYISTGGGAMLSFIEKGTLPGIEALKNSSI